MALLLVDTLKGDKRIEGKDIAAVEFVPPVDRRMDSKEGIPTNLFPSPYQSLYRVPCPSLYPILSRIRVSDSCILGRDNQHNSRLLFQSWVLSPKVLFYLLLAFFFTSIFVFMHTFNYEITHKIYKHSS